jgi:rhodanese-related sulfurtransferase
MTPPAIVVLAAGVMFAALIIYRFLVARSIPRVDPASASERVRHGYAVLLDVRTGAERGGGRSGSLTAASRLRHRGIKASSLAAGIGEWNFVHRVRR